MNKKTAITFKGDLKPKKLKEKSKTKTGLKIFTILCVLLIAFVFFYTTYAYYEEQESLEIINGNVEDPGDLYFVIYVDGEITYNIPSSTDGYVFSSGTCTNGATVSWNSSTWSVKVNFSDYNNTNSNSAIKCTLNFKTLTLATSYITSLYFEDSTELAYDGTTDSNVRYIGASPNNYIDIGDNVLWRIIGVFEVDDGSGNTETRLKIIRSSSIGNYSWDTSEEDVNDGYGVNEWSEADLMKLLNDGYESETYGGSLYWDSGDGYCYYYGSGDFTSCDFTETGLTTTAQTYFDDAVWTLGGTDSYTSSSNGLASHWYEYERGDSVYSGHATTWTGKLALMYPSDYGFATSGGETTDRETCLATELSNWGYSECRSNDWLYNTGSGIWTLSAYSADDLEVFRIAMGGSVTMYYSYVDYAVYPTGYLSSSVAITSGDGSESSPFIATIS